LPTNWIPAPIFPKFDPFKVLVIWPGSFFLNQKHSRAPPAHSKAFANGIPLPAIMKWPADSGLKQDKTQLSNQNANKFWGSFLDDLVQRMYCPEL
jgi:hypothetical protein